MGVYYIGSICPEVIQMKGGRRTSIIVCFSTSVIEEETVDGSLFDMKCS